MKRHNIALLSIGVAGLFLAVPSATATTVVATTGSAIPLGLCDATGGASGNMAQGYVTAVGWSQTQGYSNVTIGAALDDFAGSHPNFTAYLTTQIGPGTSATQEIASASVVGPNVANPTTSLTTIFTGLTVGPGTYYLTIYGDVNAGLVGLPPLPGDCWTYTTSPTTTLDTGVTLLLGNGEAAGVAAYPPASAIPASGGQSFPLLFQVTGTPVTPPSLSKSFGSIAISSGGSVTLSFTVTNPNSSTTLTGIGFSDTLPSGLMISTPNGLTGSCGGGTISALAGSNQITLVGGSLAASASCTFSVSVTSNGSVAGYITNTTSTVSSNDAIPGDPASAILFIGQPFQVNYSANLNFGESYIDIGNAGANGAPLLGPGFGAAAGNICVNVYAFDPSEELISCCSCLVTPGQTVNLGVKADLTSKTLTGVVPTSVTIKLLATLAGGSGTGTTCNNSAATAAGTLANGTTAFRTTLHATPVSGSYETTETPFTPATLSAGELASITGRCASIIGNASGFGICTSCRIGALGGSKL